MVTLFLLAISVGNCFQKSVARKNREESEMSDLSFQRNSNFLVRSLFYKPCMNKVISLLYQNVFKNEKVNYLNIYSGSWKVINNILLLVQSLIQNIIFHLSELFRLTLELE